MHRSWGNLFLNLHDVLATLMRLIANMLGCSSCRRISESFDLVSNVGTLRSWCRVSLVTYQGAMILRYLFWNLYSISTLCTFLNFILEIITSYHFAQHSIIHLTIYTSLEEHMPSGVRSIKLQYDQVHKFWGSLLSAYCFDFFEINREYIRMFLHPVGVHLWLSLLISSLTSDTLRSWYNHDHWWRIMKHWR